ncbi:MAG: hypothetical protein SH859_00515 [Hyphomicrobium aestuarii]|nr:hypothetical protein [Hyphomicrobium aestuarii]
MTDAKRTELVVRDTILKLLTDVETAKVCTAEATVRLHDGAEYLDLEQLGHGVQRATAATQVPMGHVIPRSAVSKETWTKIVAHLAH